MLLIISALLFLFGAGLLLIRLVVFAFYMIRIAVLLVAACVMAMVTVVLVIALGCQKLYELYRLVEDWQWRHKYGDILPPE